MNIISRLSSLDQIWIIESTFNEAIENSTGAMSEFAAIIEVVVEAATWFLERTIDVICCVLLLVAGVLPWRLSEILFCPSYEYSFQSNFRNYCIENFLRTLGDLILLPFAIVALLSPLRIINMWKASSDRKKLRSLLCNIGIFAVLDLISLPFALVGLLSPIGRQGSSVRGLVYLLQRSFNIEEEYDDCRICSSYHVFAFYIGIMTIVEWMVVLLGSISLFVPSTWGPLFIGIKEHLERDSAVTLGDDPSFSQVMLKNDAWFEDLIEHIFFQCVHAIADIVVAPFAIIAFFSPLRNQALLTLTQRLQAIRDRDHVAPVSFPLFGYRYNLKIRTKIVKYGFLGIFDILLVPFIFILWISQYRFRPIRVVLATEKKGMNELRIVFGQTFLLVIDICIIWPLAIVILMTQVRWLPVLSLLRNESRLFEDFGESKKLYGTVFSQFALLLMDTLCFCCVFPIIALSFYRRFTFVSYFDSRMRHSVGSQLHFYAFCDLLIVLHDICLLFPASLISYILGPHRFCEVLRIFERHQIIVNSIEMPQAGLIAVENHRLQQGKPVFGVSGDISDVTRDVKLEENHENDDALALQKFEDLTKIEGSLRFSLWSEVIATFIDVPFHFMSIVVYVTLWRSYELWKKVFKISPTEANASNYRKDVLFEFGSLFLDVVFLAPFAVIIATLYRLPTFVVEIVRAARQCILHSDPIFETISVQYEFPQNGGPNLILKLRKLPNKPSPPISASSMFSFQILGSSYEHDESKSRLWAVATNCFGSLLVSVLRSFLPIILVDNKNAGISEFISAIDSSTKLSEGSTDDTDLCLWIKLDTGTTKRSTFLKKARLLPPETLIGFQVQYNSDFIVSRSFIKVRDIVDAIISENGAFRAPEFVDSSLISRKEESEGLVNSFRGIVGGIFVQVILDLQSVFMVLFTLINPLRGFQLLMRLFEKSELLPYRVCSEIFYGNLLLLDDCLHKYKFGLFSTANSILRKQYHSPSLHLNAEESSLLDEADLATFKKMSKTCKKALSSFGGCEKFLAIFNKRLDLYDKLFTFYFLKITVMRKFISSHEKNIHSRVNSEQEIRDRYPILIEIIDEDIARTGIALEKNLQEHRAILDNMLKFSSRSKNNCGLLTRPAEMTHKLIKRSFWRTVQDLGALFLLLLIIFTFVRLPRLIRDFRKVKPTFLGEDFKLIIKLHIQEVAGDLFCVAKFVVFTILIFLTIGGIPKYLTDLPGHLASYKEASKCAQRHCEKTFSYICELISLAFTLKTYRLVVKSAFFSVLLPGACFAEAAPLQEYEPSHKFWIFETLFLIFLGGASYVTATNKTGWFGLLAIALVLSALLLFSILSLSKRKHYRSPQSNATKVFQFTWNSLFGLLSCPSESILLSSIILYFFWREARNDSVYGQDSISLVVLAWGQEGHRRFNSSMIIAEAIVILWGCFISLPLAVGTSSRKVEKQLAIRNSSLYEFFNGLVSRLFTVWIMATLMRPTSCDDSSSISYLSSASDVRCGDDRWTTKGSLPLLVYFIVTSSIIHADEAVFLKVRNLRSLIRFSPLFTLLIRLVQLACCTACMCGFNTSSPLIPLISIIVISTFPVLYSIFLPVCSIVFVTPIRVAGYICVMWTALLCAVKISGNVISEYWVYIGWAIIYGVSLIVSIILDNLEKRLWEDLVATSGLIETTEKLSSLLSLLIVEDASSLKSRITLVSLQERMVEVRSAIHIVNMLLNLEEMIVIHRISHAFLSGRNEWRRILLELREDDFTPRTSIESTIDQGSDIEESRNEPQLQLRESSIDQGRDIEESRNEPQLQLRKNAKSSGFMTLGTAIDKLVSSITPQLATTALSKSILRILLLRRLPEDVCRLVFSFLINTTDLRNAFLGGLRKPMLFGVTLGDDCTTSYLISRAALYLDNQEALILSVDISEVDVLRSSGGGKNLARLL